MYDFRRDEQGNDITDLAVLKDFHNKVETKIELYTARFLRMGGCKQKIFTVIQLVYIKYCLMNLWLILLSEKSNFGLSITSKMGRPLCRSSK